MNKCKKISFVLIMALIISMMPNIQSKANDKVVMTWFSTKKNGSKVAQANTNQEIFFNYEYFTDSSNFTAEVEVKSSTSSDLLFYEAYMNAKKNSSPFTINGEGRYTITVTITDGADEVSATSKILVSNKIPQWKTQPTDVLTEIGKTSYFNAELDAVNVTYQWYVAKGLYDEGSVLSGATDTKLTISSGNVAAINNGNYYYCKATTTVSEEEIVMYSNYAKLSIEGTGPTVTFQPTAEPVKTEAPTKEPMVTSAPTLPPLPSIEPVQTETPTEEPVVTNTPSSSEPEITATPDAMENERNQAITKCENRAEEYFDKLAKNTVWGENDKETLKVYVQNELYNTKITIQTENTTEGINKTYQDFCIFVEDAEEKYLDITENVQPTEIPTEAPSKTPVEPSALPPSSQPTTEPTTEPTTKPTMEPTALPTINPTASPSVEPTVSPTATTDVANVTSNSAIQTNTDMKLKASYSVGKITLKWSACQNASLYIILRSKSKNGQYVEMDGVSGLSYKDKKLSNGKTYYYKINAYDSAGVLLGTSEIAYQKSKLKPVLSGYKPTQKNKVVKLYFKCSPATKVEVYVKSIGNYNMGKKWKKLGTVNPARPYAKIVVPKACNKASFRIRAYAKIGKKKYYSKWTKTTKMSF